MNVKLPSIPTLLSFIFGAGGPFMLIVGALNLGSATGPIDQIVTGVGGLLTIVTGAAVHNHVSKAALTKTTTTATVTIPKGA